ncbi:hypothetical protein, partial [Aeromonas veronii]|uniref:hypothetical protein n=1 Tax=Aeromonas veronii TaxID=654 RepID=UPI003D1E11BB
DAVSAHTDCLIQIVKERRNSVLLRELNSTQPPSRVKPYFQRLSRLSTRLFALPLALSMWRIIEIQLTLARLYRNKIAKKFNFLVIHINAQPLYRLIHNQGWGEDVLHRINALQGYWPGTRPPLPHCRV